MHVGSTETPPVSPPDETVDEGKARAFFYPLLWLRCSPPDEGNTNRSSFPGIWEE